MTRTWRFLIHSPILFGLLVCAFFYPVHAQGPDGSKPIDMMILVDNSCSMFPSGSILAGCDAYGSDPNQLRITGADLFIARLGFGEPNEADYRLGVIGFGRQPVLISALEPLPANRDRLAKLIADPQPQSATQIIPALQMAYTALQDSSRADSPRLPAVVMITDGVPWPREGQSNVDIENVVSQHDQIPLFMMLLKNPLNNSAEYDSYIDFWQKLAGKYQNIFVYLISDSSQIQDTYNQILSKLQNTIPAKAIMLAENGKTTFQVGTYVEKVIVTSIRPTAGSDAFITITDPKNHPVTPGDPGVSYYRGQDNPVEVYILTSPRLPVGQPTDDWTVTSSAPVTMMVDWIGSYRFSFLAPKVESAGWGTHFQAPQRQYSDDQLLIRFQLVDRSSLPVLGPQPIQVTITNMEGNTVVLPQRMVTPDSDGAYDFPLNMRTLFPSAADPAGRYQISFTAGRLSTSSQNSPPVANASLGVELGKMPSILTVSPTTLYCRVSQPTTISVSVADVDAGLQDILEARVSDENQVLTLTPDGNGGFSGDLSDLCSNLLSQATCATITPVHLNLALGASSDLIAFTEQTLQLRANVISPACVATTLPTLQPTPTAQPTAIPDRDQDQVNDLVDRCPDIWGLQQDQGCIPGKIFYSGGGALLFIGLVGGLFWPWMKTSWISPAPVGYISVYQDHTQIAGPVAIHELSRKKRKTHLTVGGNRHRADIFVAGLRPVEYLIEWQAGLVSLREPGEKELLMYFGDDPRSVRTSEPKITLKIGTDLSMANLTGLALLDEWLTSNSENGTES